MEHWNNGKMKERPEKVTITSCEFTKKKRLWGHNLNKPVHLSSLFERDMVNIWHGS